MTLELSESDAPNWGVTFKIVIDKHCPRLGHINIAGIIGDDRHMTNVINLWHRPLVNVIKTFCVMYLTHRMKQRKGKRKEKGGRD